MSEPKTPYYVAIVNERHSDTEPYLFITAEAAIAFARKEAAEYARTPEDVEESDIKGWLYYATWGNEGDCVWVIEKTFED